MAETVKRVQIVFQPSGRRGEIEAGKSVLEAARTLGVGIEAACGGARVCGKCRVVVETGRFEKLKSSVDKQIAKQYFEKIEGCSLSLPKVNIKIDKLLREFILRGGFEV